MNFKSIILAAHKKKFSLDRAVNMAVKYDKYLQEISKIGDSIGNLAYEYDGEYPADIKLHIVELRKQLEFIRVKLTKIENILK